MIFKKALVIDGNSMFYRMYYATQNQVEFALKNNLVPNNAIKLMINNVIKLISNDHYEYCLVAFDAKEKTFRHEVFNDYKKNRDKTPDELIKQMNDCIIALQALGLCVKSINKIEADDLVGSFSKKMEKEKIMVDIYSSDKDLLQLVSDYNVVHLMKTGISMTEEYNIKNFQTKFFNLTPQQVIDYKAIIGDSSDCLPGVKGIGPKTGVDLIIKYGSLENIYNKINELSPSQKSKFIENEQQAKKCKMIATIKCDVFDHTDINEFKINKINYDIISKIINKYKLKKLESLIENKETIHKEG